MTVRRPISEIPCNLTRNHGYSIYSNQPGEMTMNIIYTKSIDPAVLAAALIKENIPFYCEPYPEDEYRFETKEEYKEKVAALRERLYQE